VTTKGAAAPSRPWFDRPQLEFGMEIAEKGRKRERGQGMAGRGRGQGGAASESEIWRRGRNVPTRGGGKKSDTFGELGLEFSCLTVRL
jgi:hypothetical protein